MKKNLSRILTIAIGLLVFSGCATSTNVHRSISIPTQCNFEKFTDEEKSSMSESTGKRIFRNQENCRIRQARINSIIDAHNRAHK